MTPPIFQFLEQVKKTPNLPALRDHTGEVLTYGELANQSLALAAGLQKLLGLNKQHIIISNI